MSGTKAENYGSCECECWKKKKKKKYSQCGEFMMIQLCHSFENNTSPSAKTSVSFQTKETNKLGRLPTDTTALWLHVRDGIHKAARRGKKAGQRLWQINVQPVVACQALCAPAKWNTESACVRVTQNPTACVGWWWWWWWGESCGWVRSAASFTSSAMAERADTEALSSSQPTASSRHVSTVAGVASAVKSHLTFLLLIGGQKVGHSTY